MEAENYAGEWTGSIISFFSAEHNKKRNRIEFITQCPKVRFTVYNDELGTALGFSDKEFGTKGYFSENIKVLYTAPNPPVFKVPTSIYVYTDIVVPERVGDVMASLLRAVPVQDSSKDDADNIDQVNHTFQRVYYKKVNRNSISSILIEMYEECGKELKFESGVSSVVLHFRKVSI